MSTHHYIKRALQEIEGNMQLSTLMEAWFCIARFEVKALYISTISSDYHPFAGSKVFLVYIQCHADVGHLARLRNTTHSSRLEV